LEGLGVELAVHSYDHVDFRGLASQDATGQFARAAESFSHHHIHFEGFRCPYLSCHDCCLDAVPNNMFKYSSNQAIWWDVIPEASRLGATSIFKRLDSFYGPASSEQKVATPRFSGNFVEIPVSLPDDLQLYDGLRLGAEGVRQAWSEILQRTHRRGELFALLFHPESYHQCALAFESILQNARALQPSVWLAPLQEISRWWWEKSCFGFSLSSDSSGTRISFDCSEKTAVLVRDLDLREPSHAWDSSYRVLESRTLHLTDGVRPLVGISPVLPAETAVFLKDQGYLLDVSEQAPQCSLYLDDPAIGTWSEVQLIHHIESASVPLVRFSRWPAQAKSALCVSGDLDALSLRDYASRIFNP
jgi:hypothetical protein